MKDIVKRTVNQISGMNSISKKVIKYGFEIFLFLIFISIMLSIFNNHFFGNVYKVTKDSIDVFKTSFSILAITVVGAIIMDFISKKS